MWKTLQRVLRVTIFHLSFRAIHYELQICHPVSLHHNYRDRWLLSVVLYALIRRVICKIMQNTDYLQNNTKYEAPRKHTSAAPTLRSLEQSSHGRSKILKKSAASDTKKVHNCFLYHVWPIQIENHENTLISFSEILVAPTRESLLKF